MSHRYVALEFKSLLRIIFPPKKYPQVYDTLEKFEWVTNQHHWESFREHSLLTGHWMQDFCHQKDLLQDTWNGITYARLVGFFHDFGKPFVRKNSKPHYTGHAQVGARMFYMRFQNEIPEETLLTMCMVIDSHMCYLRCQRPWTVHTIRTHSVMNLHLNAFDALPALECLHRADSLGKFPQINDLPDYHTEKVPVPYHKDAKIAIFLIGPSGSGKTTLAKTLLQQLSETYSCQHLERDSVLMEFAQPEEVYADVYRRVYADSKLLKEFQQRWIQRVNEAAEHSKAQVILIDTAKNYYYLDTSPFVHYFRIGMYCVPMRFKDSSLCGKAPHVDFPPQTFCGYSRVLTEAKDEHWDLEVGTGVWQAIPIIVKCYLERCQIEPLYKQPTMATLWKRYPHKDSLSALFNPNGIVLTKRYELGSATAIYSASYYNSKDVTYSPTRYYRGDFFLTCGQTATMIRSGFPTFSKTLEHSHFEKIIVTPKCDGSLVNILYVPEQYQHFDLLKNHFPNVLHLPNYGLLFVGSKNTLLMDRGLKERFNSVIQTNLETFIRRYIHYLGEEMLTLHFEMMVETFSQELTVYYSKNFCKFLGYTTFTDDEVVFHHAKPTDADAVEQIEFEQVQDMETYIAEQYKRLLAGDLTCEPEGFVLYVYDKGLKDIVKRKFPEFYVAHKPELYQDKFEKLLANLTLKDRFQKCRQAKDIRLNVQPIIQDLTKELNDNVHSKRKDFALYLQAHKEKFNAWQRQLDEMAKQVKMKPVKMEPIFFRRFPNVQEMIDDIVRPFKLYM